MFGSGSISGVDVHRFAFQEGRREKVRDALGIKAGAPVFLFLGRIQRDKGLHILADAFLEVLRERPDARLLLVGPDEQNLVSTLVSRCEGCCVAVGLTSSLEDY